MTLSVPRGSSTLEPAAPTDANDPLTISRSAWRLYSVAAVAIMLLAIFLRLWDLNLAQFKDDQAALLRLAEDLVRLGRVPLAGMTDSLGAPLPPNFEYVLAPIVAVSRDPRVATAAIGLANAAGIGGTILFGWRRFSPLTGVVAGLVYATNPWAVFFARKVWSNDVLAPMAVVLLFCLDNAVVGGQLGWSMAAFPVFALGAEFHPSFVLLGPLPLALAVIMVKRHQLKHLAIGIGLAILTAVPYLIYNLQTQWSYLLAPTDAQPQRIDSAGAATVIGLIGGWRNWKVDEIDIEYLLPARLAAVPGAIETVLLAIGIAAGLVLVVRSRHIHVRVRAAGLLLWVLVPIFLTLRHAIPLYDYYYLYVLPAGALLIGLGVDQLAHLGLPRRSSRLLVGGALTGLVVLASMQSVIVLRELQYLRDSYVVKFGPPLEDAEQTTQELLDLAQQSGAGQLSVEIDDVNDVAIGYLARPYMPQVQVAPRRRGPWNVNFDLPNTQSGTAPYRFAGPPQLTPPQALSVTYADGVRAISAATTRFITPGESMGLALTWAIDQGVSAPLTNRLVWELSLYDPSGREVRRVAGLPHDTSQLSDGETVLSWITVATGTDAAEGPYQVRVDRLDPVSRRPIPALAAEPEWSAGTVDVRRN